jgi:hypothetical protein
MEFEIRDYGVGAYPKLRVGLHLASDFEAVQELSKGKRTTDASRHTGGGIFFSSKAIDIFRLTSSGVRWTVDNLRHDVALGVVPDAVGTSVVCQIDPQTDRELSDVFRQFTNNFSFTTTRPVVKLFEIGTSFVSRSEARRLLTDSTPILILSRSTLPAWRMSARDLWMKFCAYGQGLIRARRLSPPT